MLKKINSIIKIEHIPDEITKYGNNKLKQQKSILPSWHSKIVYPEAVFKEIDNTPKDTIYYIGRSYHKDLPKELLKGALFHNKKDLDKIKTYCFIPKTVFDRAYFKRMYPDLKCVKNPDNADVVFYDKESLHNSIKVDLFKILNTTGTFYLSNIDTAQNHGKIYYAENTSAGYINNSELIPRVGYASMEHGRHNYYEFAQPIGCTPYNKKLMLISDFLEAKESEILHEDLSVSDAQVIFAQLLSNNTSAKKAAVDSILNYKGFDVTKKLVISLVGNIGKLKSTKASYYIKANTNKLYKKGYNESIFYFVNQVTKDLLTADAADKEIVRTIINSKEFQNIWFGKFKLIDFELKFNIDTEEKSAADNIASFIV